MALRACAADNVPAGGEKTKFIARLKELLGVKYVLQDYFHCVQRLVSILNNSHASFHKVHALLRNTVFHPFTEHEQKIDAALLA